MAGFMDLPVDLVISILLRLNAKLLMRFKIVCISWYQLISSPHFARLHLEQTSVQTKPKRFFVFSTPDLSSAEFDTFKCVSKHNNPFGGAGFPHVVGSCHGLICLCSYDVNLTILVYNPTTRTHKTLPFLHKPSSLAHRYGFGFGYDEVSEDYKVVRILQSDEVASPFRSQVMIYSSRADSWVRGPDVPFPFYMERGNGVVVDGIVHWAHKVYHGLETHYSIISFSLQNHSFGEVQQPDYGEEFFNLRVGMLDGCLCLLVNDVGYSDIWVMKKYGVMSSWSRLLRIDLSQGHMFFEWLIGYSSNRREIFLQQNTWKVVSVDVETKTVKDVKVSNYSRCIDTQVCVENLMMLKDESVGVHGTDYHGKKRRKKKRDVHQVQNFKPTGNRKTDASHGRNLMKD